MKLNSHFYNLVITIFLTLIFSLSIATVAIGEVVTWNDVDCVHVRNDIRHGTLKTYHNVEYVKLVNRVYIIKLSNGSSITVSDRYSLEIK